MMMPNTLLAGDTVRVADREAGSSDMKSGLFYNHYRGLSGTLSKIYEDGTAAVTVDLGSLSEKMRVRHEEGSEAQRKKWLNGLSDEARNRLSAAEKRFSLRYTILVSLSDLQKMDRAKSADLDAAETDYLQSRQRKS
jgi:hypothetical protein